MARENMQGSHYGYANVRGISKQPDRWLCRKVLCILLRPWNGPRIWAPRFGRLWPVALGVTEPEVRGAYSVPGIGAGT